MTIDRQLYTFFPHTVTIYPYSSQNNYGENSFGTTRSAPAYVEPNRTLSMGMDTVEESKPTTAYIADTSITLKDKIVLPDGTTPRITSIATHTEVIGLEHTVVQFQ